MVRTLVFIEGSNFGTDISRIQASIGGIKAPVIGSSGEKICIMAPRRSNEGTVKISIENKNGVVADYTFEDRFVLHSTLQVSTLTGKVDKDNNSSVLDGSFEEAEFQNPHWLELDTKDGNKSLYVIDVENLVALRKVDLLEKTVSTVFTKGQAGFHQVKSSFFDASRDTLFFVDDNGKGSWTDRFAMPNLFYTVRSENFRKAYPYTYAQCSYSGVYMSDGSIFHNTWTNSEVIKAKTHWNTSANTWDGTALFHLKANSSDHVFMVKHPDDLYVYMCGFNGVYKCVYNKETRELENPVLFAGDANGGSGWNDAPGGSARFNRPRQGVFVKNQEYVDEGKADHYDFYVADHNNNAIRKVTPDAIVSTFAGRGSVGTDGQVWGWIDGEARETARFREPCGIAYDPEEEIFYVADRQNKRIRTISVE